MSDSKLRAQSMDFAVQIINLVKYLKEKRESIISNQIGRSGTSIGANGRSESNCFSGMQSIPFAFLIEPYDEEPRNAQ